MMTVFLIAFGVMIILLLIGFILIRETEPVNKTNPGSLKVGQKVSVSVDGYNWVDRPYRFYKKNVLVRGSSQPKRP